MSSQGRASVYDEGDDMIIELNEEVIKKIAEIAAADIQRQYPGTDYLTSTVRIAVIEAANKVMDLDVRP